jgi:hypothetical protein
MPSAPPTNTRTTLRLGGPFTLSTCATGDCFELTAWGPLRPPGFPALTIPGRELSGPRLLRPILSRIEGENQPGSGRFQVCLLLAQGSPVLRSVNATRRPPRRRAFQVDPVGFEPTTFSMPLRRAPNCAMGPGAGFVVDLAGFEPATSSVRLMRAPNCATGPRRDARIVSRAASECQPAPTQHGHTGGPDTITRQPGRVQRSQPIGLFSPVARWKTHPNPFREFGVHTL